MEQVDMKLAEALGFSADDLAANRGGSLSEAQSERLRKQGRRTLTTFGILLLIGILMATAFLYGGQRGDSAVLTFIGMALTVINAVIVGMGAQSVMRGSGDLARGKVEALTGSVTHTIRVTSGRVTTYVLKVDGKHEMIVPKPVFTAFEEDAVYTMCRAPASKTLLSAEKIG